MTTGEGEPPNPSRALLYIVYEFHSVYTRTGYGLVRGEHRGTVVEVSAIQAGEGMPPGECHGSKMTETARAVVMTTTTTAQRWRCAAVWTSLR